MFGFFKKKDAQPPPYRPASTTPPVPEDSPILEAAIVKLRTGDQSVVPAFLEALSKRTVTIVVQKPGDIRTCLLLDLGGVSYIAVFTKPDLSAKWRVQDYQHPMQVPMTKLCAVITSDAVGLTINPEHPIFGMPLPPPHFKHFREVLASMRPPLQEGGLYYCQNDDATFSVLKILKLDEHGVHIRQYSNQYPAPPPAVEESTLFMLGMDRKPEEKLGMGHLPISKNSFAGWDATFFHQSTVSDEELEGYKMWLEAKGGYF